MIDLGGIGVIASVSHGLIGRRLDSSGATRTMNNLTDGSGGDWNFRGDGVK